jgi:hypothetical protein
MFLAVAGTMLTGTASAQVTCPPAGLQGNWEATSSQAMVRGAYFTPSCNVNDGYYNAELYIDGCPHGVGCRTRSWYGGGLTQLVGINFGINEGLAFWFTPAGPQATTATVTIWYTVGATVIDTWTETMTR